MEERYHATTQNRFYPDMSNVNKNITVEAKLISPHTYILILFSLLLPASNWVLSFMLAIKNLLVFLFSLQHPAFKIQLDI